VFAWPYIKIKEKSLQSQRQSSMLFSKVFSLETWLCDIDHYTAYLWQGEEKEMWYGFDA
jgi:hypothetical protein